MQSAPKRQVNAEDMLAELKRVVEASTLAPGARPASASTAAKPISAGREKGRSQINGEGGRPVKANPEISVEPRPALQKSRRPRPRSWKLIAGGVALAAAAIVGVSFALMNKASNAPEREPSAAATARFVKEVAPVQAGEADAKHPPSAGAQSSAAAFTQTPPGLAATPVPSEVIRPDGTPIAPDRPAPGSIDSAPSAQAPKTAAARAAAQPAKPDTGTIATAPAPASTNSAHQAPPPKTAPPLAVPQPPARPDEGTVATAPAAASTNSAHSPQAPKTAAAPAAAQTAKPDGGTTVLAPASTVSAPPPEAPKPNATSAASISNESAEPSAPKLNSRKKSPEKTSLRKPRRSAKASTKSVGQAKRRAVEPAQPKEAEKAPEPAPAAGSPAPVAPAAAPSVPQRLANGVTGAFGYLAHLPGALIPHLGGGNGDAH